jgi:hypothetical protein
MNVATTRAQTSPIPAVLLTSLLGTVTQTAAAYTYPEHRDVTARAVRELDAGRRATFDRLWQDARVGDEGRLCAEGVRSGENLTPSCFDWPELPPNAGDHSCSSAQLLEYVRTEDWLLGVAVVGAQLGADLARTPRPPFDMPGEDRKQRSANARMRAELANVMKASDVEFQQLDTALATRALTNDAHFPLARPDTSLDPIAYADLTLSLGSRMSSIGAYAWYHVSALQKASRLAREQLSDEERRALARAVLFDEAFALHFLEDTFAAGHVAGSWGDVSQRKGTHDFYNQNGLEVFTWEATGTTFVLMGDAHMRPEDAELISASVRRSLEQVLDATAAVGADALPHRPMAPAAADDFDVCVNTTFPARGEALAYDRASYGPTLRSVLLGTPVPGLGAGFGAPARFRSEIGTFIGLAGAIDGRWIDGAFLPSQTENGFVGAAEVALRAGVGFEGVVGEESDGLVFASLGFRSNSNSSSSSFSGDLGALEGSLSSAIPPRSAYTLRLRAPFWLIPGDLLFASPLYFINREKYTKMAITASNGGLIPWQLGHATRAGRFQFIAGRELGVTFYGHGDTDQLWVPTGGTLGQVLNYKSTSYDLPIFEYRPYRSFSSKQSSSVMLQFFVNADVPDDVSVAYPVGATAPPDLDTLWSVGIRMVFDWRHYR